MSSQEQRAPSAPTPAARGEWLLLVHQLPPGPSNSRVKTWRRLLDIGAVSLRNAVYVLPNSPQAREDFAWIRGEIVAMHGQATVLAADAQDEVDRRTIVEAFRSARAADFTALRQETARAARLLKHPAQAKDARAWRRVQALAERLRALEAVDFFAAPGCDEARRSLAALEELMPRRRARANSEPLAAVKSAAAYQNRTWVTRRRPGIDRMSSAWLIRRFIDPAARFEFAARDAEPPPGQVAFDMFGGEFTHQADRCTFEVLMERFRVDGPPLRRIAEIVHDIDLKDHRYGTAEAPTIGALVEGILQAAADDHDVLERGMDIFEALYRSMETAEQTGPMRKGRSGTSPGSPRPTRQRRSSG